MLEAEFRRAGVTMAEINEYELLPPLLKRQSYVSVDDLYAAIGYGGMTAAKVANRLRDELLRAQRSAGATGRTALDKMKDAAERRNQKDPARPRPINGVLIAGLDNCLLKFARCCTPVAGDEIVGFITRGYGVSIHRTDCKNHIVSRVNPDGEGRWVDATWDMSAAESYITTLHISSYDRNALVMDISTVLNGMNAKVRSFNARDVGAGMASTTLNVEVRNLDELKAIMARLATIQGVKQVSRGNG